MRHKHADLIIAWANGADIECKQALCNPNTPETWMYFPNPQWNYDSTYRIKPKPDVVRSCSADANGICRWHGVTGELDNLKLTFDGETGALKAAEVIS